MFILWNSNLLFFLVLDNHDFDNYSMIGYIFLFIFLLDDFYQSLSSVRRLYGTFFFSWNPNIGHTINEFMPLVSHNRENIGTIKRNSL